MLNAVLGLVNRKCVIMKENLPRMDSNHDKVIQSHAVENAKEVRERGECGRSKTNVLSNKLATKRTSNHKSLLISNLQRESRAGHGFESRTRCHELQSSRL
jgi:hypothetical protein